MLRNPAAQLSPGLAYINSLAIGSQSLREILYTILECSTCGVFVFNVRKELRNFNDRIISKFVNIKVLGFGPYKGGSKKRSYFVHLAIR